MHKAWTLLSVLLDVLTFTSLASFSFLRLSCKKKRFLNMNFRTPNALCSPCLDIKITYNSSLDRGHLNVPVNEKYGSIQSRINNSKDLFLFLRSTVKYIYEPQTKNQSLKIQISQLKACKYKNTYHHYI